MATMEERIQALELDVEKLKDKRRSVYRKKFKDDKYYIGTREFEKKFSFMSLTSLRLVLKEDYFIDYIKVNGINLKFNLHALIRWFESGMCESSRLNNQYRKMKEYNENLKKAFVIALKRE